MSQFSADSSIPLLTEVIDAPAAAEAPVLAASFRGDSPLPQAALPQTFQSINMPPLAAVLSDEQLQQIRREIQDEIMQQLLGQLDSILHRHLQDQLPAILDNLADTLTTHVRASLEQAWADGVALAAAKEAAKEAAKFENVK